MSTLKLTYFNGRGLAETSRILLAIANEDYIDDRYPLEIVDWKTHTFVKKEFDQAKAEGLLKQSRGKLPFLTVDGEVISQSKSIERYLARRLNMMGANEIEGGKIDAICECVRDIKDEYQKVRKLSDIEKEKGMEEWFNKTLVERLNLLEDLVGERYAVGEGVSLADVTLYNFLIHFFDNKEGSLKAMSKSLHIKSIVENVSNLENVKKWIELRPVTAF